MPIEELRVEHIPGIQRVEVYAHQNILNKTLEGNWTASFKGRGMEFAGYRRYTFGDDASTIDWKASLKSKVTLVKEYEEERMLNVIFLVDVSNSMLSSSTGKLKCEYAAEVVASLMYAVLGSGDAVGLAMFSDRLVTRTQPNIGKSVYYLLLKDLLNPLNYGGGFDLRRSLSHMLSFVNRKSIVVIISDFIGLQKNWEHALSLGSGRNEIIGVMIRDPRDRELPDDVAQYIVNDPYSGEKMYIDTKKFGDKYKEFATEDELNIEREFKKHKSGFVKLYTDKEYHQPLITFFKKRSFTAVS